jgi:spore coat-associated protein N
MGRHASKATRGKVLTTVSAVGAAAAVAGLGTFGTFTSTTSASTSVSTGTVSIALGASGPANRMSVNATGLVPGDTVQRAADLSVTGDQALSSVSLTTSPTTSSVLDTDATNGLQMTVDMCSAPWTESGTAPAYTYTCNATQTSLVGSGPVIGSNLSLAGVALAAGSTSHLRVTLSLPTTADNTFQGKASVISFAFTGTQRAGTAH